MTLVQMGISLPSFGRRFWYLKLHALTALRDFDGLNAFARSRRSPIGYEAFVRHLVSAGHLKEAASYVIRCDAPKRIELYVLCEDWRAAGRECKERGDKKGLEYVFLCHCCGRTDAFPEH